ncbi:hypothetical protein [Pontibacter harenae]|uniref:hypothetical protein n=1 Tax=Pontibacter harenae TaxID=2894083 RepID=UPI001E5E9144|nr:hypothetical protein [Pontibacter harenae]MCC9165352.1 hypothetical protein [Pontibacter harenae]
MKISLQVKPSSIYLFLLKVLAVLILLNFVSIFVDSYLTRIGKATMADSFTLKTYVVLLFDFNAERNLPTYFNTLILAASAGLLFYVSKLTKRQANPQYHKQWLYLGCIFAFLALDELFMLHELLGTPFSSFLRNTFQQQELGVLYYAWIVPYLVICAFIAVYYFKFIFSLPKKISVNFVIAGTMFVTGAVGMEMIEGYLADLAGGDAVYSDIYFKLCVTVEETLEMLGIIFFIRALLSYLAMQEYPASLSLNLDIANRSKQPKIKLSEVEQIALKDKEVVLGLSDN